MDISEIARSLVERGKLAGGMQCAVPLGWSGCCYWLTRTAIRGALELLARREWPENKQKYPEDETISKIMLYLYGQAGVDVLEFRGGLIEAKERVRTSKKAHSRLLELTEEIAGPQGELEMVGFVSAAAQPAMEELRQAAHERFTIKEEFSGELSPVLGTHVGIGTVGIAFLA